MSNVERLEQLIEVLDNMAVQFEIDGLVAQADKIRYMRDECMWLHRDMTRYE